MGMQSIPGGTQNSLFSPQGTPGFVVPGGAQWPSAFPAAITGGNGVAGFDPNSALRGQLRDVILPQQALVGVVSGKQTMPDPLLLDNGVMDQYFDALIAGNMDQANRLLDQIQTSRPDMFAQLSQSASQGGGEQAAFNAQFPGASQLLASAPNRGSVAMFNTNPSPQLSQALNLHKTLMASRLAPSLTPSYTVYTPPVASMQMAAPAAVPLNTYMGQPLPFNSSPRVGPSGG